MSDACEYIPYTTEINIDSSCFENESSDNNSSIQERIAQLHKDIAEIKSRMQQSEFEVNEENICREVVP